MACHSGQSGVGSSPLTRGKRGVHDGQYSEARLIPAHAGKTSPSSANHRGLTAHPRSRGENGHRHDHRRVLPGSSPLTRGKLTGPDNLCSFVRLIPAHAGKTVGSDSLTRMEVAHPRSRGENYTDPRDPQRGAGSSPLTRGKLDAAADRARDRGLIPAHAGKTPRRCRRMRSAWAHPRSRGENHENVGLEKTVGGSSPLTRGKPG